MDPSHVGGGGQGSRLVSFHRQNTNMLTNPFVTGFSVSPPEIAEERYCRHSHYSSLFYTALLGRIPELLDKQKKLRSSKQQHTHLYRENTHRKKITRAERSKTRIIKMKMIQVLAGVNTDVLGTTAKYQRACFSKSSV